MNKLTSDTVEKKIITGLENCNVSLIEIQNKNKALGVAVSGGADSICLLISLANILCKYKIPLKVITVNHFIREAKDTCGDVEFVEETCKSLKNKGFNVSCCVKNLKEGQVFDLAEKNKSGIEDAARILRYELFEEFIKDEEIEFLCLAHNKNDNIETIIMRFLQGASVENSTGIPLKRGKYIRPMIDITRDEIELYLKENNQQWRTDCTNFDNNYLRNNIRNNLIPFLNKEFSGWQKGVLNGSKKNQQDKEIIESIVDEIKFEVTENGIEFERDEFNNQKDGIKIRILLKAINLCNVKYRIPYVFLNDVINAENNSENSRNFSKSFGNIIIQFKNNKVFVKKSVKSATEIYFSAIIEEDCKISLPCGEISFIKKNETVEICNEEISISLKCSYPLRIRNFFPGDEIKEKSGNLKKINEIFSDWHIDEDFKELIPVIEELNQKENKIICILGSFLGFKNWIV